ncbi:hypothetical protein M4I32_04125 [Microbacterium sp. LRZ72]|uniref:hypothetical protein n=1 Tax=Microbacterium sp. LRZ72 TaxID=2942481 RepID=UPI0029A2008D|nr:hypothetical protein [Microbacterium sp. LRZ72]MDX2375982.1 hypothetical protein [Microbacterium sp. LRZ72]
MKEIESALRARPAGPVPGAAIIRHIRRLIYAATGSAIFYSVFMGAGKGGCAGGTTATGGFLDENGDATETVPTCVQLTLGPNPLMLVALAAVVIWALSRVLSRADNEDAAIRTLDRAALAVMIATAVSVVLAQVWFSLIPLEGINGSGTYFWPFPFGSVDFESSPMTTP